MTETKKKSRGRFEDVGHDFDRALKDIDEKTERLITYLNDEVVPAVRDHSTRGLRAAARELERFAEYMERTQKK